MYRSSILGAMIYCGRHGAEKAEDRLQAAARFWKGVMSAPGQRDTAGSSERAEMYRSHSYENKVDLVWAV